MSSLMRALGWEYQSEFARRYVDEGKEDGRAEVALKLLATRFGRVPEAVRNGVYDATKEQVFTIAERLLTAQTIEEALGSLGWRFYYRLHLPADRFGTMRLEPFKNVADNPSATGSMTFSLRK